jgi:hypothetical protein
MKSATAARNWRTIYPASAKCTSTLPQRIDSRNAKGGDDTAVIARYATACTLPSA